MTIQLSNGQECVIYQAIETGKYRSVNEVLDSALDAIKELTEEGRE